MKKEKKEKENKYHCTGGLHNGDFGVIQYWKFRNRYIFLNYEKGIIENIKNIETVTILSDADWKRIYDERNVHEGNERERQYGKLHEGWVKIWTDGTTGKTGQWSSDFCRELASMKSYIELEKELRLEGGCKKSEIGIRFRETTLKHVLGNGSTYDEYCTKMFDEELSEQEIIDIIIEYYSLPQDWQNLNENDEFGMSSDEMKFYLKHPTIPDIEPYYYEDEAYKTFYTQELKEFLESRASYTDNLSLSDALNSLEQGNDTEKERIRLTKQILKLYDIKKDKKEIDHHTKELEESEKHYQLRKNIIILINLSDDKKIKIQEYFKSIENKLNEKVN